ncbi:hypothetical protein [Carnobacterium maltaromaticum]|uniref:hypothetical protein n=1 Tax=Carnobacterium maltaromaticum TaxID=2751 RepID=UPI0039B05A90
MFILAQIVNLELIQKSEPGWFTPGNIVSILVAIIAASAVIYNAKKTTKTMRENNKDSINANLTAKARIEWIQVVRVLVSELMVTLEKFNGEYEWKIEEVTEFIYNSKSKINLIQLYLGPDSTNNNDNSNDHLLNMESNDGKNNLIYKELELLYEKVDEITKCINFKKIDTKELVSMSSLLTSDKNVDILEDAKKLKEIFRIYFKIVWKEAKLGK